MKLRLRYIYGVLILLGTDILFLVDILFQKNIPSIYICYVAFPSLFFGFFIDKKFGYFIDNHKTVFNILGVIILLTTFVIMTYMVIYDSKN